MTLKACRHIILLVFLPWWALAQQSITGSVVSLESGQPVASYEVFVEELGEWYTANERGEFRISNLQSGVYNLFIVADNYQVIEQAVTLSDQNLSLIFSLEKLGYNLPEIEVKSETEQIYGLTHLNSVDGMGIYAGKKTEVILMENLTANLAANNARQIYSRVTGLNIYESGDAGLQLSIGGRGLDPNRSASFNVRQNGYDISADVLGYPESYYSPPAEALNEIQVIRGAASLQYGTQFGGLVNFRFKRPNPDKKLELVSRQSTGSFGLFTSFNSLSGTSGKWSYYTYFHYKRGDGFRENSGFDSKNFYGQVGYAISEAGQITLEYTHLDYLAQQAGGLTDAQFYRDPDFSNRERNWFAVNWNLFSLKYQHRFSSYTEWSVNVFGLDASRDALGFRTNRVSQVDSPEAPRDLIKGTFQNWGAESRFLHRYEMKDQLSVFLAGVKIYRSRNTAWQGPGTAASNADFGSAATAFPFYPYQSDFTFPNLNLAFFAENIFYLNEQLSITPGLRYEYIRTQSQGHYRKVDFDLAGNPIRDQLFEDNTAFERNFLLSGLGLSWKPRTGAEVYGNISQNYRSVTFNDIRVVNPSFQIDPNISDEHGFTADVGFRGKNNRLSWDVGAFTMLYNDRLGEVLKAEKRPNAEGMMTETGRIVRFRGNIGQALIYGFEGIADWTLWQRETDDEKVAHVNYFVNLALIRSEYLRSEIPGVVGNSVEFIPAINLKTGLHFGYRALSGSIQYTRLSEQFTDASNAPQDRADNQSGIVGSIPAYDILDLSMAWEYRTFTLEGGINNLLNRSYFTRRATGYPGPGIIPSDPRTFYLTLQVRI